VISGSCSRRWDPHANSASRLSEILSKMTILKSGEGNGNASIDAHPALNSIAQLVSQQSLIRWMVPTCYACRKQHLIAKGSRMIFLFASGARRLPLIVADCDHAVTRRVVDHSPNRSIPSSGSRAGITKGAKRGERGDNHMIGLADSQTCFDRWIGMVLSLHKNDTV
jgi:hypothetical protein